MSWSCKTAAMAIVTIAITSASLPVAAEDEGPDYARLGFYVGAGAEGGEFTDLGLGSGLDADTGAGFNVFAGYRAHAYVSAELEFEMLPEIDIKASGFGKFAEIETWAITGNVKAFPLTGRIQPFALVGIGALHGKLKDSVGFGLDESDAGFAARFGGGLDVYATEHVVVWARSTYVLPTGDVSDVDYVSFGGGLQYRF